MSSKKTPAETAVPKKKPRKKKQPHGGAIYQGGVPGNNGGRPPDEFKRIMASLASADEVIDYLRQCLRGKHGPKAAVSAHKHVTERGYGKVPQDVDLRTPNGPIEIAITRKVVAPE